MTKSDKAQIPMPEYGVSDIRNRVTYIPTRHPWETPEEALENARKETKKVLIKIARLLGEQCAREEAEKAKAGCELPVC